MRLVQVFPSAMNDMLVPPEERASIGAAEQEVKEIEDAICSGLVTQGERYNKVVDIWGRAGDQVAECHDGSTWRRRKRT